MNYKRLAATVTEFGGETQKTKDGILVRYGDRKITLTGNGAARMSRNELLHRLRRLVHNE